MAIVTQKKCECIVFQVFQFNAGTSSRTLGLVAVRLFGVSESV